MCVALLAFAAGCARTPVAMTPAAMAFGATRGATPLSSKDLIYVADSDRVDVFDYPQGKKVQTLTGFLTPAGLCTDGAGDVFVTDFGGQGVTEYAHGGSSPLAKLRDPYQQPDDCAVDPSNGNLAVANIDGSVSIYEGAKGKPQMHADRKLSYMLYLTYDSSGDLFVDGEDANYNFQLAELPPGAKGFEPIALDRAPSFAGGMQWDGQYLAIADQDYPKIYQYAISGSAGTTQNVVALDGASDIGEFWDMGSSIAAADLGKQRAGIWSYPGGGKPEKVLTGLKEPLGITLSKGSGL